MRAVIQRVTSASVTGGLGSCFREIISCRIALVDGEVISKIAKGLMVLVGIGTGLRTAVTDI
jgi:D-Tyr-tRNAtyr deacylase